MTAQLEEETVIQPTGYDPFPEPQTIPTGWDVSELICEREVSAIIEVLAESESS